MTLHKRSLLHFLVILTAPALFGKDLLETDWATALDEARETGQHVFVAFLGEGWSIDSRKFQKAVLDSQAFLDFADERLVTCTVKARRKPRLSSEETARLQALVIHFDIKSWPTFILIAPDGREVLRHGYRQQSAEAYVALLKALLPDTILDGIDGKGDGDAHPEAESGLDDVFPRQLESMPQAPGLLAGKGKGNLPPGQ